MSTFYIWDKEDNRPLRLGPFDTFQDAEARRNWFTTPDDYFVTQLQPTSTPQPVASELETLKAENARLREFVLSIATMTSRGGEWTGWNGDNLIAGMAIDAEKLLKEFKAQP